MARRKTEKRDDAAVRAQLLAWYDAHQRDLPWRRTRDPYAIWVSEIMLQQTRVAVVVERFRAFLNRFPTIDALARGTEEEVLALWSGLGYYRRARMLHKAAQCVVDEHGGKLPASAEELRKLPGIGGYTAAAIASIAHDEPIAAVDGNVERVVCRLAGWEFDGRESAGALRKKIETRANELLDPGRPGDFNQAMMELGATVCVPRNPQCLTCPIVTHCTTRGEHRTARPLKMENREAGHALAMRGKISRGVDRRQVLLVQRPKSQSVMPGMWELPSLRDLHVPANELRMTVRHAIMNVNYTVQIRSVGERSVGPLTQPARVKRWAAVSELGALPLTGLARKVLTRAHLFPTTASRPEPALARVGSR